MSDKVKKYSLTHRARLWLGLAVLLLLSAPWAQALAGRDTVTIETVTGSGPYTLTLNSSSGITAGDYFVAKVSGGSGGVWLVATVTTSSRQITVTDSLTQGNGGSAWGAPAAGSGWYSTPPYGASLAIAPYLGVAWDARDKHNETEQSYAGTVLDASGDAAVSSSTSSYSACFTHTAAAYSFAEVGSGVRVTCNLRQATGTGVNAKLSVGGTSGTAMTIVGKCVWEIVRTNDGNLTVFGNNAGATCAYFKDSVTSLNYTTTIAIAVTIQGGDAAGGTAVDFVRVERLRGR